MSDTVVINDKRLFTRDGQVNPDAKTDEEKSSPTESRPDNSEMRSADLQDDNIFSDDLPPANFAGLLIGLATSAFIHLGESPDPSLEAGAVDLPAAKHAIDLLAVLQEKTRGNLEKEEDSLLTTLLYDLRLKFVQANTGK